MNARNLVVSTSGLDASALIYRCDDAESLPDVESVVSDLAISLGYEYYLVRGVVKNTFRPGLDLRLTNYPTAWLDHYRKLRYCEIDPASAHARTSVKPTLLADLTDVSDRQKLYNAFRKDVGDAGLLNGITIPLRSCSVWGFVNFNGDRSRPPSRDLLTTCTLVGVAVVDALERLRGGNEAHKLYAKLTYREKQVLFWSLAGKTAWETAIILSITERTVVAHLCSGMRTMRCVNKSQLIGIASEFLNSDPALADSRIEL